MKTAVKLGTDDPEKLYKFVDKLYPDASSVLISEEMLKAVVPSYAQFPEEGENR